MEVNFAPELENSLIDLAERSGRSPNELVEEVMADYVWELAQAREKLDSRYDDLASGRVKGVDAVEFLKSLKERTRDLIRQSSE